MTTLQKDSVTLIADAQKVLREKLTAAGKRIPLIVGEWNAQNSADGLEAMTEAQKDALYRMVAESFQNAFAGF